MGEGDGIFECFGVVGGGVVGGKMGENFWGGDRKETAFRGEGGFGGDGGED